ncbi:MAG TPA: AmmeMemoRadiSam system radical SAM enzyme [Actinomycetaceae bacterium]|nr:AmmeMemoRadiSam system radical SAM enzyme [Actinomycetaceae bacterium]
MSHVARWWHMEGDRIQCDLCPRECRLRDGQRGFCFVRIREGDQLILDTYGRSSGFCLDPIEKKPLNHFLPGTAVLSFGTAGCNLGCKYCQNWDISKSREWDTLADQASPEAIAKAAVAHGSRSVAFTYNDPVIFAEYALDVAAACQERGVAAVAVSAGYINEPARHEFFGAMDAANIDLKGFTEEFYRKLTGGHFETVLETLRVIHHETDCWLEITNLVIPGHNDSDEEISAMSRWIATELGPDVPVHFSAFHPAFRMLDVPSTRPASLRRARELARAEGLNYVYTGNVHDTEGDTTWCSGCGAPLIVRDWYQIEQFRLDRNGRCPGCRTPLPGVFEPEPGNFGRRRVPIRLGRSRFF